MICTRTAFHVAQRSCLLFLLAAFTLASLRVSAQEVEVSLASDPAPGPSPEQTGTAVLMVQGELASLDATAGYPHDLGGGVAFQVLTGREHWHFMVGLGGGVLSFDGATRNGPSDVWFDDGISIGPSTISRGVELRHAELLLRIQPFWGIVRPFIEGQVGMAVLWQTWSWETPKGTTISAEEEQRSLGLLYGGSIGIDWRIYRVGSNHMGATDFVLTTGVKRAYTTRMERPVYRVDDDSQPDETRARNPLAMWTPFIGIALSFDTRAAARTRTPSVSP